MGFYANFLIGLLLLSVQVLIDGNETNFTGSESFSLFKSKLNQTLKINKINVDESFDSLPRNASLEPVMNSTSSLNLCGSKEYLLELTQFSKNILSAEQMVEIREFSFSNSKKYIKKIKKMLRSNEISYIPKCNKNKETNTVGTKMTTTHSTGVANSCNEKLYLPYLINFAFKIGNDFTQDERSDLRDLFRAGDLENIYQKLRSLAKKYSLEIPYPCNAQSITTAPPRYNCTVNFSFQKESSLDQMISILSDSKNKSQNKLLTSEDSFQISELKNNVIWSTICQSENVTKQPPISQFDEMMIAAIKDGYIHQSTFDLFKQNAITRKTIIEMLRNNKDFIKSRLPPVLRKKYDLGKIPKKYEEILLNNMTKLQKKEVLYDDDEFYYLVLPSDFGEVMKNEQRLVPVWFKELVWTGSPEDINKTLRSNESYVIDLIGAKAYFIISLITDPQKSLLNEAITVLVCVCLICGMVPLGCTMTFAEIMKHARKPKGVVIALTSQFVVMPAAALGLTKLFELDIYSSISILICGCCPGGNISNILAYALNGDMNLSILMTTCSSIIGLGMMPLNIFIYSRFILPSSLLQQNAVPFDKIMLNIVGTVAPVIVGILIRRYKPRWVDYVMKGGFIIMILCFVVLIVLVGYLYQEALVRFFPVQLLSVCCILPICGFTFGYFFAWVAREKPKSCRTIMVETGCQNAQLCASVLRLAFNPVVINILFIMPMIYAFFQIFESFAIILIYRMVLRCKDKPKIIEESSEENMKLASFNEEYPEKQKINENITMKTNINEHQFQRPVSEAVDIDEVWPLEGAPTEACLNSFEMANSENLV